MTWKCLHTAPTGEGLYMQDPDPSSAPDAFSDCPRLFLRLPGVPGPDRNETKIEIDYHEMVITTPTRRPAMIAMANHGGDIFVRVPILVNGKRLEHWSRQYISLSTAYQIAILWGIPVLLRASGIPDTYLNIPGCEEP